MQNKIDDWSREPIVGYRWLAGCRCSCQGKYSGADSGTNTKGHEVESRQSFLHRARSFARFADQQISTLSAKKRLYVHLHPSGSFAGFGKTVEQKRAGQSGQSPLAGSTVAKQLSRGKGTE